ncbi:hypothetical protein EDD15DRAFT_705399 [Pisolithus albus]|nr:hypothetical protein EDD15DRAFT_705399 [Pisolithus albus]
MSVLRIASKDFRELGVLQYGQETATVMTAYSAIFLLRLLRSSSNELPDGACKRYLRDDSPDRGSVQHSRSALPDLFNRKLSCAFLIAPDSCTPHTVWCLTRSDSARRPFRPCSSRIHL